MDDGVPVDPLPDRQEAQVVAVSQETVDELRRERDALVLALAESANRHRLLSWAHDPDDVAGAAAAHGSWHPEHGDDADADEWAVVHVEIGSTAYTWTVPREKAEATDLPVATCCLNDPQISEASPSDRTRRLLEFAGV